MVPLATVQHTTATVKGKQELGAPHLPYPDVPAMGEESPLAHNDVLGTARQDRPHMIKELFTGN